MVVWESINELNRFDKLHFVYWQLVLLRMLMAAGESGCNPLATGIMSDVFPEKKRALVMAIFNWGIYGGYGIAFPVGRYITQLNIWDLVS